MSQTHKKKSNSSGKRRNSPAAMARAERAPQAAAAVRAGQRTAAQTPLAAVVGVPQSVRAASRMEQRDRQTDRRPASEGRRAENTANFLTIFCRRIVRRGRRLRRHVWETMREEQARNFPESDNLLVQMLLLVWSLLPMWTSMLREHTWGRRKQLFHRVSGKTARPERRGRVYPVLLMAAGCAACVVLMMVSTYTKGTTVTYDGEVIAVVASEDLAEEVRTDIERATTRTLGQTFTIDDSLIQYSSGWLKKDEIMDEAVLEENLSEEIGLVTPAYCLYVDGEFIGATPYEGALEELLEQMSSAAHDENTISSSFKENVEIKEEYIPSADIVNLGYIAETLYSTKTAEVTYEVKKGDTWSAIARDHEMTSDELLALNPGYDINKLQIGEILTLSASVPYLTLTVVQQERYVDEVNYNIEYTNSADMYQGDYKITSPGQYGAADVVASVTYVNGVETDRTILSSVTLKEPVTEQRIQGTKERPTWYPTGSFRWPTSGRVTSYFGGRKSPGGIGSTNHKGIDIANGYGTGIYAADGGTVIKAGWQGGYGYTVQIQHNNGYTTLYAHNSRLLVSVGQKVYKGQQIARMGSTGNSTGNHCHFEIRLNGVAKNPMNYLP